MWGDLRKRDRGMLPPWKTAAMILAEVQTQELGMALTPSACRRFKELWARGLAPELHTRPGAWCQWAR